MSETTTRVGDRLSEAKRLLLEKRLAGQARPAAARSTITRRGGGPVHPMSWSQERLWFLDQVEPGSPFYNIPIASLVSARLDVDVLERALSEIIRRHEGLRTVFRLVEGEPRQIVQPPYRLKVEIRDIRGPHGDAAPEEVIRQKVSEEGARPFDLATGPLMRATLLRVSEADYAIVITVHHIVTDGWSMPIVTRELDELYGAFAAGKPSPLPQLAVQYADYSAWQREYLSGSTLQKQLDYWRTHLDGAPTLELPTDRPRPPVQTHRGAIHRFVWSRELTEKLRALGVATGSSMNMVIMAGYYLMLHQYSGQDDVVVGTLLGNRNRAETEPIVGFFVNSAPIRARLRPEMTFAELVRQVRTAVLDADAHQDLPFDKIVEELRAERDPSRNPLFQVMYFHHTFVPNLHHKEHSEVGSDLNMRSLFQETGVSLVDTHATKFDMTFATLEMEGRLACMVEYSSDLWSPESMARMIDHVRVLLDAAGDDPDLPLSAFSMVSAAERDTLLAWGTHERPFPRDASLVSLFQARADASPGALAVEFDDGRLTYGELNAEANRVARRLAALGVRPGDRVGLAAGQSARMAAALAGILKAGAAVVPLDPDYPAERLAFMVQDTGARVVVTRGGGLAGIAPETASFLDLERDAEAIAAEDARNVAAEAGPESIAYVIYTSGSTGRPKGVLVPHRAVVRTVVEAGYAPVAPGDRVAQTANLSFDAAIWEVWAALLNGAATVGIGRDALLSTDMYARALRGRGITHTFVTTQLFSRHVRQQPDLFAPLACVLFGGEKVDVDAVRACVQGGRPGHLLHVYGPTETTVFATAYAVGSVDAGAHTVPIGRPVGNTRAYVLDARGTLCGTGVPGELFIGGEGVAAGYLDRPQLTAERFVGDPFAGGGARMYRTGDRVRWTEEGQLEFLGRLDDQVKVRGFRIEPGEVEAALRQHPSVRDAAVAARGDGPGERRLVGYVAGEDADALRAADFRAFLRERLPDYMVPSAFVALDALPLTPNGKVDRRHLPAPEPSGAGAAAPSPAEAPRGRMEEVLCEVWREVLRVGHVGIHENFFSLGGDSIVSIQIIARAGERGIRLTPKQMFVHQTVAELAAVATEIEEHRAEQDAVTGPVALTPVQRWFLAREIPDARHFNIGLLFDLRDVQRAELERAVAAIMAHHDALRLRFRRGPEGWSSENAGAGGPPPLEFVDLSAVPAGRLDAEEQACATAIQASLDLEDGLLIRFAVIGRGPGRPARLLVAAHHLVVDAISLRVVMDDLEAAYRQLLRGHPVSLPMKTTSFRQWADRLVEYAGSREVRSEEEFWLAQEATPPLPRDADGPSREGDAERITASLDGATTRALLQDVPPVYGTQINDALLAALAMAFRGWTGESAVRIDLEGHGREDLFEGVDLSRTVGWFTAIYPVRLELPEGGQAGEALKAAKERLRSVPRRGVGYGLLRWMGDTGVARALAAVADPEVSFNYLGQMNGGRGDERLFTPADAPPGEARSPRAPRAHLLSVDALVAGGELHATWTFSPGVHRAETVRRLADGYLDALRAIVDHCRDPEAGGFTPSDFELAGLDQGALDALLAQIGE